MISTILTHAFVLTVSTIIALIVFVFYQANYYAELSLEDNAKKLSKALEKISEKEMSIRSILNHLVQGVFTISKDQRIHADYSRHLEQILGTEKISGADPLKIFVEKCDISADQASQIKEVFAGIGQSLIEYEVNAHLLPKELKYQTKILEIDWEPIVGEDQQVDRLLVIIKDVTKERALAMDAANSQLELKMISEILTASEESFYTFQQNGIRLTDQCRNLIEAEENPPKTVVENLYRNAHTLKGIARTFGFASVIEPIRACELQYSKFLAQNDISWDKGAALENVKKTRILVDKYQHIYTKTVQHLTGKSQKTRKPIGLKEIIDSIANELPKTAKQLGKSMPKIKFSGPNPQFDSKKINAIQNAMVHILRNSLDHGIEQDELRRTNGKTIPGEVHIQVFEGNKQVEIRISDDGAGIDIQNLRQRAIEKNLIDKSANSKEIAEVIFSSGFSQKDNVTDISGCGVGLSAVRSFISEIDGTVELILPSDPEFKWSQFLLAIKIAKNL